MKFVRILLIFLNKISIFFHFNADPVPGSGARIHSPEKNIRSFALMWIWNPVGWGRLRLQPKWDCFSQCCGARAGAGRSRYFLVGAGGDVKAKTFFYYFLAYFYMKRSRSRWKKSTWSRSRSKKDQFRNTGPSAMAPGKKRAASGGQGCESGSRRVKFEGKPEKMQGKS